MGLRAGRFVWRSPPQPKGGLSLAQVPMEPGRGGEAFQRLPHPCAAARAHTHADAHAQELGQKHGP